MERKKKITLPLRKIEHRSYIFRGYSAVLFVTSFPSPHGRFAPPSSPVVVVCDFVLLYFIGIILNIVNICE
ncbi:hypothetical protein RB195_012976 [Necator americanus]|uniref:Transmembrane protein n=1 Tax=Necator americanus TaxID=51031 RepID=A0ABR1DTE4_NECAM